MATSSQRRKRYVRNLDHKLPLVLQPRDREIVRLVAEHRVISSNELTALLPGSEQGVVRRLQALYHHGYLDRPRAQRINMQNAPMFYALGPKGAEVVALGANQRLVNWSEKNRQIGEPFLEHAAMISRFRTALTLAVRATSGIELEAWQPDGAIRERVTLPSDGTHTRIPVAPDAFFVLKIHGESTGKVTRVSIMLEADRGTMDLKRFATKVRGYLEFWRSGAAKERIGARSFLVATIAREPERAESLLHVCQRISGDDSGMFVVVSENAYLPLDRRVLLDPIWRTPADDALHALTE